MKKYLFILIALFATSIAFSQSDSLILKNGDVIIGELKNMDKGIVKIETDYSDDDFTIEWDGIKEIYTVSFFMITLSDGSRLNGKIESAGAGQIKLLLDDGQSRVIELDELVFLKSVDKGFWDQVYANVDIGLDITKANNLKSFSTRSGLGYLAEKWSVDLTFNTMFSKQDSTEDISRTDGGITYKYYLPHDWYIPVTVSYLSNTEQRLDARWNSLVGIGKYLVHTNRVYWGVGLGASFNNESYYPINEPTTNTSSWEGYFGTELNMFDIGDLSLLTNARAFPGITDAGRWRVDFNFDAKYDLPMDFYIKLGYSLNYDNQPVAGASDLDYVLHTGIGWEW